MTLKNSFNIAIVGLWIFAQMMMVFNHPAMAGQISGDHMSSSFVSMQHVETSDHHLAINLMHEDSKTGSHHNHASLDECCDFACSAMDGVFSGALCIERVARILEQQPVQANKSIYLNQPTPPPDTIAEI